MGGRTWVWPIARSLGAAGIAAATFVLLTEPTGAKPGHGEPEPVAVVSISGPSLGEPILLSGKPVWRLLYLTTFRGWGIGPPEPPAPELLGPALEARYRFVQPDGDVQTLRQTLYPCVSDGRVWSSTPSGQDHVLLRYRWSTLVQTGWWHSRLLPTAIPELLAACDRSESVSGVVVSGDGPLIGAWIALGALLAFGAVGALERSTERRSAVRA